MAERRKQLAGDNRKLVDVRGGYLAADDDDPRVFE